MKDDVKQAEKSKPPKLQSLRKNQSGWTLVEMAVVIGIVIILVGIVMAALGRSKTDSVDTARAGTAKTVNEAIARAYLKGDTNQAIYGENADDIAAAIAYLTTQGYLRGN